MIEIKGRNGYFKLHEFFVHLFTSLDEKSARIELYSKRTGDAPPAVIQGSIKEVGSLLVELLYSFCRKVHMLSIDTHMPAVSVVEQGKNLVLVRGLLKVEEDLPDIKSGRDFRNSKPVLFVTKDGSVHCGVYCEADGRFFCKMENMYNFNPMFLLWTDVGSNANPAFVVTHWCYINDR